MPKIVGDLGKIIVTKGFENLHKLQLIALSGYTEHSLYIILRKRSMQASTVSTQNLLTSSQ